jgi:hypothetical protein
MHCAHAHFNNPYRIFATQVAVSVGQSLETQFGLFCKDVELNFEFLVS